MPALDDEALTDSMRTPLPADRLGHVRISASRRQDFRDIVRRHVETLLADDQAREDPQHETKWMPLRRIEGLTVYSRRLRGHLRHEAAAEEKFPESALSVMRGCPSMRVKGTLRSSIENMIFAFSANTQNDLLTGMSMMCPLQDAALLSIVETSTDEDPLRSAEVIWQLTNVPMLHHRDFCYLKASGTGVDAKGRRYGYAVFHSVDLPECPPFDYRQTKILRGKTFFSFLFRETALGSLNVVGRGVFDLNGSDLLRFVLQHAPSAITQAILRAESCSAAKKLTLLALKNAKERKLKATLLSKKSVCSMCIRRKQRMIPGARLRPCDGCGVPVCKGCKIKNKYVFLGTKHPSRSAVCCMMCANQIKAATGVRLGAPEFLVEAEYYCRLRSQSCDSLPGLFVTVAPQSSLLSSSSSSAAHDDSSEACYTKSLPLLDSDFSAAMTNVTLSESCASIETRLSFSGTLSDEKVRHKEGDDGKEECKSGVANAAAWIAKNAEVDDAMEEIRGGDSDRISGSKIVAKKGLSVRDKPTSLLEWMRELQSSADVAYSTTMANEELMKLSIR